MEISSPRFKALAVTLGFSVWYVIISSAIGLFSFEVLAIFVSATIIITQIFALKLSNALNIFAIFNTKVFLGMLYIFVISVYGILFKALRIDPLRTKKKNESYWLEMEQLKDSRITKQY